MRSVSADGRLSEVRVVAKAGADRANDFSQLRVRRDDVLFAWTDRGVRTARMELCKRRLEGGGKRGRLRWWGSGGQNRSS